MGLCGAETPEKGIGWALSYPRVQSNLYYLLSLLLITPRESGKSGTLANPLTASLLSTGCLGTALITLQAHGHGMLSTRPISCLLRHHLLRFLVPVHDLGKRFASLMSTFQIWPALDP